MAQLKRILLLSVFLGFGATAWGAGFDPYIGYVYPAGGQQGTTFQVTVGGQRIKNVDQIFVGGGVRATVIGYEPAGGPLNKLQQDELRRQLEEIRAQRTGKQFAPKRAANKSGQKSVARVLPPDGTGGRPVVLPDLPDLRNLDQQTPEQLRRLVDKYLNFQKRPKPPIAEQLTLQVTIDANAATGDRELRVMTPAGLSNPIVFQVGQIPEIRGGGKDEELSTIAAAQAPVVLNGQIMPGEVDRWPLQLKGGQKIVIAAQARKLIPYLADAVPGWFQAAVSVVDASGKELAYDDDCGFVPDPALSFQVPQDGLYTVVIRDAIYRGREDFVYRVDIGDAAAIKPLFPLGSRGGVPIGGAHADWQEWKKLAEDHFRLAENHMPESDEKEPNDTGQTSMPVTLPHIINGCISAPGDKDVFRIEGHAGDTVVAEVFARRMGSPLDSLLRLIDIKGNVVAINDDHEDPESGLFTHHADSYILAKLPATGRYFVQISDAEAHGGPEYRYSLRISQPQPDFALRITPSCLNMTIGRPLVATVYAVRKDGWDGDIDLALRSAPADFVLSGAVIPKGRDHARVTITPQSSLSSQTIILAMEGRAQIGGQTVTRPAIAAENMMQAFAYHHLVPAQHLMATIRRGYGISTQLDLPRGERVHIPAGGTAQVSFSTRAMPSAKIRLELSEPPAGVTLQDVTHTPNGVTLTLKADEKHVGYADNIIVEAFTEAAASGQTGPAAQKQTPSVGFLPAIPFQIDKK